MIKTVQQFAVNLIFYGLLDFYRDTPERLLFKGEPRGAPRAREGAESGTLNLLILINDEMIEKT